MEVSLKTGNHPKGPGPDVQNAHEIIFRLPVFHPQ